MKMNKRDREKPNADLYRIDRHRAVDEDGIPYHIISDRQYEAIKAINNRGKDRRHFSFAHMRNIRDVIARLSTVNCGRLLILTGYINYRTGILVSERGRALNKKQMREVVGLGERAFRDFYQTMTDNDIIQEIEGGQFRINPQYHFAGKVGDGEVVKAFTTAIRKLAAVLRPAELGFVYKLLPHVHYETNMICADPFEVDPQNVRFYNVRGIAELVEMNEDATRRVLNKLRKAGVLAETRRKDDLRDVFFILNPYVFYRRKGRPDKTLKTMFASSQF